MTDKERDEKIVEEIEEVINIKEREWKNFGRPVNTSYFLAQVIASYIQTKKPSLEDVVVDIKKLENIINELTEDQLRPMVVCDIRNLKQSSAGEYLAKLIADKKGEWMRIV